MLLQPERELIVEFARRLRQDGLVTGTSGNISVRSADLVAVTPSGLDYDELTPGLVCVVDLEGHLAQGRCEPTSELPLHLQVYAKTDAGAVVHTHSPYATVLGTVVRELPAIHYLIADLGGSVRVAPYATPGSQDLAEHLGVALAGRRAALLANHGTITVARSLRRAYSRSLLLEWLAALYYRARLLGEPALVGDDEVARVAHFLDGYLGGERSGSVTSPAAPGQRGRPDSSRPA